MQLFLFRHGIAIERTQPDCPAEPDRFLTEEGRARTAEVALGLKRLGCKPDLIISSPYVRARQTAELVAEAIGYATTNIRLSTALVPEGDPIAFLEEISDQDLSCQILCAGHAPQLDDLLACALGLRRPITSLKKAGVACLEMQRIRPPLGYLAWLAPPKLFRKISAG